MTIAAVIFDMDGVLADTECFHFEAEREVLARRGVVLSLQVFQTGTGLSSRMFLAPVLRENGLTDKDLEAVLKEKKELLPNIVKMKGIPTIEGVETVVKYATARYPCAVASSSTHNFIDTVIQALGFDDILNIRVSAEDLPPDRGKPHPDIYLLAARKLSVGPKQCLAIEDAAHGVTAARAAGMYCIGFRNPNSGTQDLSQADLVVERMADILPILRKST